MTLIWHLLSAYCNHNFHVQVGGSSGWGTSNRRCDETYLRLIDGAQLRHPTLGNVNNLWVIYRSSWYNVSTIDAPR